MWQALLTFIFLLFSFSDASPHEACEMINMSMRKTMITRFNEADYRSVRYVVESIINRPDQVTHYIQYYRQARKSNDDCTVCRCLFETLFENIEEGQSDEEAIESMTNLCIMFDIDTEEVCAGVIAQHVPIVAHIIREVPEATPEAFCALILQELSDSTYCAYDDPRQDWTVDLPEKSEMRKRHQYKDARTYLEVTLLSDLHIDPWYQEGSMAICDELACCREESTFTGRERDARRTEVCTRSDEDGIAGPWGDYNCDTSKWVFENTLEQMAENHKFCTKLYYTGGSVTRGAREASHGELSQLHSYVVDKMKTLVPQVLVIPTVGTHESQPAYQFAPSYVVGDKLNSTWLYDTMYQHWKYYLEPDSKESFLEGGNFVRQFEPGLRVISLNNCVAHKYNWWIHYDPLDSKKHLDWLIKELYDAEQSGDKVHILAHIPPGIPDLTYVWTREYYRIVSRFSDTIAAEFNGYEHTDEFKVFFNEQEQPMNVAFGVGSLSSYGDINPSYKYALFDGFSYDPVKMVTYSYSIPAAMDPDMVPEFVPIHDLTTDYEIRELSAEWVGDLLLQMATYYKEDLDMYIAYYSKLNEACYEECDDKCKLDILCKAVTTVLWDNELCEKLRERYYE